MEAKQKQRMRRGKNTLFTAYCPGSYNKTQPSARTLASIYEYDFCPISSRKYFIFIYFYVCFLLRGGLR